MSRSAVSLPLRVHRRLSPSGDFPQATEEPNLLAPCPASQLSAYLVAVLPAEYSIDNHSRLPMGWAP